MPPVVGSFEADFGNFHDAVDKAEVKLKSMESGSERVAASLSRMVDNFSGRKVIQDATVMAEAVERIGGASKLTDGELQKLGAQAQAAVDKLRALGEKVPDDIQRIADLARGAAEETLRLGANASTTGDSFSAWSGKFDLQKAISDPIGTAKSGLMAFAETLGPVGIALSAGAVAAGALGAGLFELASNAAEAGANLDDLHDKTGLSVPALSQLSNASKVIGADLGQLTDVVFKLQRGLADNTKDFQAGLAAMGLSTAALKAAGPDRYLELVTEGLKGIGDSSDRAAAGSAVLGKGYKEVAAALMDLNTGMEMTADLSPWTAEQAAAAEAFSMQVASLKTHVSAAAIAIGAELIPAMSTAVAITARTALAIAHIVDLGGLLSNTYKGLKGLLGENALAEETYAATLDTTQRLFAQAAAEGLKYGDQVTQVATKMIALGFTEQKVAEMTGLAIAAVRALAGDLRTSKDAAADYAGAWERINAAFENGAPTLAGVSESTKGLVADMRAYGAVEADIATATGLTIAQLALLTVEHGKVTDAIKAGATEIKRLSDLTEHLMGADDIKRAEDFVIAFAKVPAGFVFTTEVLAEMNIAANKALDAFKRMGVDAPPAMQALEESTRKAFGGLDAFVKMGEKMNSTLFPPEVQTRAEKLAATLLNLVIIGQGLPGGGGNVTAFTGAGQAGGVAPPTTFGPGQGFTEAQLAAMTSVAPSGFVPPVSSLTAPIVISPSTLPSFAAGGSGDFGSGALAVLHGREAIVPLDGGGAGTVNHFVIHVNGTAEDVARKVMAEITRSMKVGRKWPAN